MSKNIVILFLAILLFLTVGIGIGYRLNNDLDNTNTDVSSNQSNPENTQLETSNDVSKVNDLITYQVPNGLGW